MIVLSVSGRAAAQVPSDECSVVAARTRARALRTLSPTEFAALHGCGRRVTDVLVTLIHGAAVETDRAVLNELVLATASNDAAVFSAAADLTRNAGATGASRVAGMRIMLRQAIDGAQFVIFGRHPQVSVEPSEFRDSTSGCTIAVNQTPRNEGLVAQIVTVSDQLLGDRSVVVRNLARCLDRLGPEPEARLTSRDVQMRSLCSHLVAIKTTSRYDVTLDWVVGGTKSSGVITVPRGKETTIYAHDPGDVAVSYKGRLLAHAIAPAATCP